MSSRSRATAFSPSTARRLKQAAARDEAPSDITGVPSSPLLRQKEGDREEAVVKVTQVAQAAAAAATAETPKEPAQPAQPAQPADDLLEQMPKGLTARQQLQWLLQATDRAQRGDASSSSSSPSSSDDSESDSPSPSPSSSPRRSRRSSSKSVQSATPRRRSSRRRTTSSASSSSSSSRRAVNVRKVKIVHGKGRQWRPDEYNDPELWTADRRKLWNHVDRDPDKYYVKYLAPGVEGELKKRLLELEKQGVMDEALAKPVSQMSPKEFRLFANAASGGSAKKGKKVAGRTWTENETLYFAYMLVLHPALAEQGKWGLFSLNLFGRTGAACRAHHAALKRDKKLDALKEEAQQMFADSTAWMNRAEKEVWMPGGMYYATNVRRLRSRRVRRRFIARTKRTEDVAMADIDDDVAPTPPPPKPQPEEETEDQSATQDDEPEPEAEPEPEQPKPKSTKRKRSTKAAAPVPAQETQQPPSPALDSSPAKKRRRGRPSKPAKTEGVPDEEPAPRTPPTTDDGDVIMSAPPAPAPVKRGRGRPRKSSREEATEAADSTPPQKKKRKSTKKSKKKKQKKSKASPSAQQRPDASATYLRQFGNVYDLVNHVNGPDSSKYTVIKRRGAQYMSAPQAPVVSGSTLAAFADLASASPPLPLGRGGRPELLAGYNQQRLVPPMQLAQQQEQLQRQRELEHRQQLQRELSAMQAKIPAFPQFEPLHPSSSVAVEIQPTKPTHSRYLSKASALQTKFRMQYQQAVRRFSTRCQQLVRQRFLALRQPSSGSAFSARAARPAGSLDVQMARIEKEFYTHAAELRRTQQHELDTLSALFKRGLPLF